MLVTCHETCLYVARKNMGYVHDLLQMLKSDPHIDQVRASILPFGTPDDVVQVSVYIWAKEGADLVRYAQVARWSDKDASFSSEWEEVYHAAIDRTSRGCDETSNG